MPVIDYKKTDKYTLVHGDCVDAMKDMRAESVALAVFSPPFLSGAGTGLYCYSSDPRDISNSDNAKEFWQHYGALTRELHRVMMPGRMIAVHASDIASGNSGLDHLYDFPGELIVHYQKRGFDFTHRYFVFKNALTVRNRTMTKALAHKTLTIDSTRCSMANADQLLIFRRSGENKVPVVHPHGLTEYAGSTQMPSDILRYRNWKGSQLENRFSHWIWQRYAGAFWDDVRIDRVLPHRQAREDSDERHVHPLQLDVIDRALVLWSNPGETVFTPFMGVGSEVYGAVSNGRYGVGVELKKSYYAQALLNVEDASAKYRTEAPQADLFGALDTESVASEPTGAMDDAADSDVPADATM